MAGPYGGAGDDGDGDVKSALRAAERWVDGLRDLPPFPALFDPDRKGDSVVRTSGASPAR